MFWIIVGGIIGLIINAAIAAVFAGYAEQKGHNTQPYFWACFFLGVIGYCMVASLPDLCLDSKIYQLEQQLNKSALETAPSKIVSKTTSANPLAPKSASVSAGPMWECPSCLTYNKAAAGACKNCGKPKPQ